MPATCRPSSVEDYDRILRLHVLAELGDMPVDTITRKKVKTLLLSKINEGKAPDTVNHIKNALSGVFKLAVEAETLPANPAQRLGPPRHRTEHIKPFSGEELFALLDTFRRRWPQHHPLILVLARTGMRMGEVLALRWKDVDLSEGIYA